MGRENERGRSRRHHQSKRKKDSHDRSDNDSDDSDKVSNHKKDHKREEDRKRDHKRHDSDREDDRSSRHAKKHRKDHRRQKEHDSDDERSRSRHSTKKHPRHHDDRKDGSRKRKRIRKYDDDHEKKKKKHKEKSRDRENDASSDSDRNQKKSKRHKTATKKPDKASLHPMGSALGKVPDTVIDAEKDYFTYHQEFWVYLYREEGVRFNDLTSEEARETFGRFAKTYNAGNLEAPYYDNPPSFPQQVLDESKTTQHKWSFQTTETERRGLEQLQQGVRKLTEYKEEEKPEDLKAHVDVPRQPAPSNDEYRWKAPEKRVEERRQNRRLREDVRAADEEITGGAKDLRERQIEKRKEQAARIHGAARDKEESAGVELDDNAVYGDGDRSFQQALAQERQSKLKREEKRNSRVQELQQKERERQENMLKMLGLDSVKPGQKISIAPRKDG